MDGPGGFLSALPFGQNVIATKRLKKKKKLQEQILKRGRGSAR
jgi:hypothetical protein